MSDPALEFIPTNDLVLELQRRHEACVFISDVKPKTGKDHHDQLLSYNGGACRAIGLMKIGIERILNDYRDSIDA